MFHITNRPGWHLPEKRITPESVYNERRRFLRQLGFAGVGLQALFAAQLNAAEQAAAGKKTYPFERNKDFNPVVRPTNEEHATSYNNFYEFSTNKGRVKQLVDKFIIDPWEVAIDGLVENPMKLNVDELIDMMPMEERVYRFRCVEAWAMVVPWTGFQLSHLLEKVKPKAEAKFVKFTTFHRPDQAPNFSDTNYPWPYVEGLRLDEAMNPLTLMVTGMYGKPMPKQNGAPLRVVVPWKYGYKSGKSIVRIELTSRKPRTMWETLAPNEYPFESNVNPKIPHPRWSQSTERLIDTGSRQNTLLYNGYGDQVASLYEKA